MGRTPKQLIQGECGCMFVDGKRVRCELHEHRRQLYTEPRRPRLYPLRPDDVLAMGRGIEDPLARALYFFVYLTGARINEARDFSMNRVVVSDGRLTIRMKTLKQRRGGVYRPVPVLLGEHARCLENEMWGEVSEFLKGFGGFDQPFRKWKKMSNYLARKVGALRVSGNVRVAPGQYADQNVTKEFRPHYLRHVRASHLAAVYGFTDVQLYRFFGWGSADMAIRYTSRVDVWAGFDRVKA